MSSWLTHNKIFSNTDLLTFLDKNIYASKNLTGIQFQTGDIKFNMYPKNYSS